MNFKIYRSNQIFNLNLLLLSIIIFTSIYQLYGQVEIKKPKIGLVLSGGAVKGIAHVGVIKALEAEGIIPDFITGTSIGAIVGGLYAMGYSASQLEEIARQTSWSYYFNDDWDRTSIPLERRQQKEKYILKFEWSKGAIRLPKGLVNGEKLSLLLSRLSIPAHDINNFDELPIPFRCVATDLSTGLPKVFSKGDIALAMRASMSLPTIFSPITIDGKTYVDGGISRNFPIQDVKEMGADIVIAVDVEAGLLQIDKISSALDILDQTISFRINDSSSDQRKGTDIIIKPNLEGITGFSFDRIEDLLQLGENAAKAQLPAIKKLLSATNNKITKLELSKEFNISQVTIESGKTKTNRVIESVVGAQENSKISLTKLDQRAASLYTNEWVSNIHYRFLSDEHNKFHLKIDAEPQPNTWVKLGANYDSDLKAAIGLGFFKRNFLIDGASGRINFRISENPSAEMNFQSPIFNASNLSVSFNAFFNFYPAFAFLNGNLLNEFKLHHFQSSLKIGQRLANNTILSLGIGREQFTQNRKLFEPSKDEMRLTQTYLPFTFQYDSYDHAFFPKKGITANLYSNFVVSGKLERIIENQVNDFSELNIVARANLSHVLPVTNKIVSINSIDLGVFNYETNSFINSFFLGRSLTGEITHVPFTGLQYMGELATRFLSLKSQLRMELKPNLFITAIGNYGAKDLTVRKTTVSKNLLGAGLEIGYSSPLGPIRLSLEYGNIHKQLISYFHVGYYF